MPCPDSQQLCFCETCWRHANPVFLAILLYQNLLVTVVQSRNAMVDLAVLSACDEVVGSHSTFGRWAAYAGGKPFRAALPGQEIDWSQYETLTDLAGPVSPNDTDYRGWLASPQQLQQEAAGRSTHKKESHMPRGRS